MRKEWERHIWRRKKKQRTDKPDSISHKVIPYFILLECICVTHINAFACVCVCARTCVCMIFYAFIYPNQVFIFSEHESDLKLSILLRAATVKRIISCAFSVLFIQMTHKCILIDKKRLSLWFWFAFFRLLFFSSFKMESRYDKIEINKLNCFDK